MPLYTPEGARYPEYEDLDRRLRQPDGMGWPGDPDLWLGIGVLSQGGRQVGHRIEVWRHCEDGLDRMIGSWHPKEQHQVIYDLTRMRPDSPGFEPATDRLDREDAERARKSDEEWAENMDALLAHAKAIHRERHNPRDKFFLGGRDGARA